MPGARDRDEQAGRLGLGLQELMVRSGRSNDAPQVPAFDRRREWRKLLFANAEVSQRRMQRLT